MSTEAQRNAANGSGNMFTMSADLSEITPVAPIARNGYAPFAESTPDTLVSSGPIVAPAINSIPYASESARNAAYPSGAPYAGFRVMTTVGGIVQITEYVGPGANSYAWRFPDGRAGLLKNKIAILGDSIAAASGSHLQRAASMLGGELAYMGAVAGSKIEDQASKIPNIVSARCGTVYLHVGTNNYQDSGATIFTKYMDLMQKLSNSGLDVVVSLPGPNNGLMLATYKTIVACYYAAKSFGFKVQSAFDQFATESGLWAAGSSLDNTHPLASARATAADTFVAQISAGKTSFPIVRSRSDSLMLNPCFALDSNSDGLADSWSLAGTATGTVATSLEIDGSLGQKKQVLKITNPANGDSKSIYQQITTASGYAVGDKLLCIAMYDWARPDDTSASVVDPCFPTIQIQGCQYGFPQQYVTLLGIGSPATGGVVMGTITVTDPYTDIRVVMNIKATNTPPAGDYVLKMYRVGLINLTAMGVTP